MAKVLIADKLSAQAVRAFEARGITADLRPGLDAAALKSIIAGYDGLAVRSSTQVTAELLAAAPALKVVGRAGTGVDNIDVAAATARGVVVMNTPFGNSVTTAEHTIAMLFALARQIPAADHSTQAGRWEKSRFLGVELTGKTLGVVGCGNVGAIVADRALGLKMKVVGYDPYLAPERAAALGIERVTLDELFERADFVTLHVPLSDATRGLINKETIARMKKGVRIINCARGDLVVEEDLKAALEAGHVAGAALDVFRVEPAKANVLFGLDNVVATPHLGASTTEAQEKVAVQIAEQMAEFLLSGAVTNAVNMPSISAEDAPKLKPYMTLASQIGRFAGQMTETGLKSVTIEYAGQVTDLATRPLTAVLLQGLLSPLLDSVNMVNAPVIARSRGIEVREIVRDPDPDYQTLVALTVTTERRSRGIAGTLIGGGRPRIVRVADFAIEAELGPHMLYIRNRDEPGVIGRIGTLLGDAQVNIATFTLGRRAKGGDALALIGIDGPVSQATLERLRALPGIVQVTALAF
ncbi:MAG: phosphoglycerate dehydrogenase [Alphaproteobacteria bacterium]